MIFKAKYYIYIPFLVIIALFIFTNALFAEDSCDLKYLGAKDGCKSCHFKEWKTWKKTEMAQAFETLKPGVKAEEKTKAGLDPQKDYTTDEGCLKCHTTGFGKPNGYKVGEPADDKEKKLMAELQGVSCEACHGPGSKYVPLHEDVKENQRKYKSEEFYAAGAYKIDSKLCETCHNTDSPTAGADYTFDFEKKKTEDAHEVKPLELRED